MKCTIINPYRGQFCYARISLDEVYNLIKDGSLRPDPKNQQRHLLQDKSHPTITFGIEFKQQNNLF